MKRRTFIGSIAAIPLLSFHRQTPAQAVAACFVLGIGVVGSLLIIYLYRRVSEPKKLHRIALEKSTNGGPWQMVMIAEVLDENLNKVAFAEEIIYTNGPCLYRVREVPHTEPQIAPKAAAYTDLIPGMTVYRT
jgi:hypothetical protein